jgi:mycofactocin biosynthesis protein MftB
MPSVATSSGPAAAFDLDRPWTLGEGVALRPERFGALAYHFGTRRLSFLKSRTLLDLVRALADHPSARAACDAVGVPDDELPRYGQALGTLAAGGIITQRTAT